MTLCRVGQRHQYGISSSIRIRDPTRVDLERPNLVYLDSVGTISDVLPSLITLPTSTVEEDHHRSPVRPSPRDSADSSGDPDPTNDDARTDTPPAQLLDA